MATQYQKRKSQSIHSSDQDNYVTEVVHLEQVGEVPVWALERAALVEPESGHVVIWVPASDTQPQHGCHPGLTGISRAYTSRVYISCHSA
jgi:glutamine cyclotransferase